MSMIGRPNMDEELEEEDDICNGSPQPDEDNGDEDDDSGDDDWCFTVKNGANLTELLSGTSTANAASSDAMLFVPEPVVSLLNDEKPAMPMLSRESLVSGSAVWVCDESDVKLLLKENWDIAYKVVCNGRVEGRVIRHNGNDVTLVKFVNDTLGITYAFTLPRACLSLEKIDAYDSGPQKRVLNRMEDLAGSIAGVGNLGPRAGRGTAKTKEVVNLFQQYYEVMTANNIKTAVTEEAVELLQKGKLDNALAAVNRAIEEDLAEDHRKELICVRSTIHLFSGNYNGALADALKSIDINPSWVKGYLRSARAYKALGKFTLASHMINQSLLLLPHSHEVAAVSEMNDFLRRQQLELETVNALNFRLDQLYQKRLFPKRGFQVDECVFEESECIACIPSMQNLGDCCCVCLASDNINMMAAPTVTHETYLYCSTACQQRSSLFLVMELDRHAIGIKSALSLIFSKAASSMNMLPLEQARLAMRLFLMVFTTRERLKSQQSDVTVEGALKHLGIYPLPTSNVDAKTRDELIILCNVMCQYFSEEEKRLFPGELFVNLYAFVSANVLFGVHTPTSNAQPIKGYYLGRLCGGVERSRSGVNCGARVTSSGRLSLWATAEIFKESKLVIAPLNTTQH